jgi:hypothetical protein
VLKKISNGAKKNLCVKLISAAGRFRQQIFGSSSLISAAGLVTVLKNDVDGDDW